MTILGMPSAELISTAATWWGAVLSTLLAFVKLWELWRDRFQIEIGAKFTVDPEVGNEVLIRNLTNRPFILTGWELLYCSGVWPLRRFEEIESAEYDDDDRKVAPHATLKLTFAGANYFWWSTKSLRGRRIFVRLFVAGRKPVLRFVYSNDS